MLLWQLRNYDKLYRDGIPDEVVYAAVLLFHWKLPVLFQFAEHIPWIMIAYKSDCQFICRDQIYCLRIWFVKTGVCIGLVKIINVKVVFRWFVLYDIILPYSFWVLRVFHFWPAHRSALVSSKANVPAQRSGTLPLLPVQSAMPHQMQDAIGFSHRLCSVMFSLYDNKMSSIFQCIQMIFTVENTRLEIVLMNIHMSWIFQQNGISCRIGCESWDYFVIS